MKQSLMSAPFIAKVIVAPSAPAVTGRWAGVKGLPPQVVRCLDSLMSGRARVEYSLWSPGKELTLILRSNSMSITYRTSSRQVFSTGPMSQHPDTLGLFAAYLLLSGQSGFPAAYEKLLAGRQAKLPQAGRDALMVAAGRALMTGCKRVIGTDDLTGHPVVWFYAVRPGTVAAPELSVQSVSLKALLGSAAEYRAYRAGRSSVFKALKAWASV